jgi:23S rRNA (adenine-N6)-dimethyltransferase
MSKNKKLSNENLWISQNYITSKKTINTILNKTNINKNDCIVEIGPGKGHITNLLLNRCDHVFAVEIDKNLFESLKLKFVNEKKLNIYNRDFLEWTLPKKIDYKVFSNIPFSITTKIIQKLITCRNKPIDIWITIEKGAYKRLLEKSSSFFIKPFYEVKIIHYFKSDDFHPKPSVKVLLVHLHKKPTTDISLNQWKVYKNFVYNYFKNPFIINYVFTKKQLSKISKGYDIKDYLNPNSLSYEKILNLFQSYIKYGKKF